MRAPKIVSRRIEFDKSGDPVLVEVRQRSSAALGWDHAGTIIGLICGLGILAIYANSIGLVRYLQGQGGFTDTQSLVILSVLFLPFGIGFVVLGIMGLRSGPSTVETEKSPLYEDVLDDHRDDPESRELLLMLHKAKRARAKAGGSKG